MTNKCNEMFIQNLFWTAIEEW